jgi:hypothetical protein
MALGSTQPLTEMSTSKFPGGKGCWRLGLTTLPPSVSRMSENVGVSTSHTPKGLHGLYRDNFISSSSIDTLVPLLCQRVETRSIKVFLSVVSAASAPGRASSATLEPVLNRFT